MKVEAFIEEQTRILDKILNAGEDWSALSIDGQRKAIAKLREAVEVIEIGMMQRHTHGRFQCGSCRTQTTKNGFDGNGGKFFHRPDCKAQKFLEG